MRLKEAAAKAEAAKLRAEREEAARAVTDLQRRHVQWQHEVRRREHEYDRLQQRLRDLLTEKVRSLFRLACLRNHAGTSTSACSGACAICSPRR